MTTHVTRRTFSSLALSGAASVAILSKAHAKVDWARSLQAALDTVSTPERRLQLLGFRLDHARKVKMIAVVELTWPPGTRRRRVSATGDTEREAAEALLSKIGETFSNTST